MSLIQSMISFKMASRVCGWHFGGSYRSSELCEAPGAILLPRLSMPVCALEIFGLEVNKYVLASLCLVSIFIVDEITTENI